MRKNLHYKVLASVLAIAGLYFYNAPAAWAEIKNPDQGIWVGNGTIEGNTEIPDHAIVYGGNDNYNYDDYNAIPNNNEIIIKNSTLKAVTGGQSEGGSGANENIVNIENSSITSFLIGGKSVGGTVSDNKVFITNTDENKTYNFNIVSGGSTGEGTATGNKVTINGNVYASGFIAGGVGEAGYSKVHGNQVIIQSGTVTGNIYGGYAYINTDKTTEVYDNNITIKNTAAKNIDADLYVGYAYSNQATIRDNTLTLNGWSGSVNSLNNFSDINFENINWDNGSTVLNIKNASQDALKDTKININKLIFNGGTEINKGDNMTFVASENKVNLGITEANLNVDSNFLAGVIINGDGNFTVDANGNVIYTVQEVKTNKQIDLVAENRAVAAAFVNQGTDLISDSLDTLSRDGNYGVKTFAAVHGNRSKYDVNSDLKINGWSTIVGVGNTAEFADGDEFSWGMFYENGSGNYRTYNEFNNEFFRGDGSLVYNGGGIAARYENNSGVYTEGSLRAGMLKSEMDNALRDGSGNYYGYDSESAYYGAHIGVGKIISLSNSSNLDVYGKFFHTYTEGDSFTVDKDKFEFDSITSDRLRIGARVTTNKANAFSTYYGLAYEYEFNGDADMRAQNLKAPTQSLQGSSYMAEVGFNYQPTPDSPWSFDLNMRGYAGEHEGASFNVQATYTF